jgi:hypothetical protein
MAASRFRHIATATCGVLGVLLIFAAFLLGYATRSLFNEGAFSARVAASLENPHFAEYVAGQMADAVIQAKPDLIGLRPVLVGAGRSIVSSPPFRAAVRRSARAAHRAIMSGTGKNIVLSVQDLGVLLESMSETHPGLAHKIPSGVTAALCELRSLPGGALSARLIRLANRMRAAVLGLLLLGVALCIAAAWLAEGRRGAIVRIGVALAILGLVLAIVSRFGGLGLGLFARHQQNSPAVAGLASAFLGGLMLWAMALGFAGLVLASASASLLERVELQRWSESVWRWLAGPQERMRLRLLRGLLGAAAGAGLLIWPFASLIVFAWLGGVVVLFAGLREAFAAAFHLLPYSEAPVRAARDAEPAPRRGAVALVTGLALVLLAVTAWVTVRSSAQPEPDAITAFNGLPALADRPLDQVIFPTSHNSMSGADLQGWMFPSQNASIERQLEDGVRGFLIDAHYGEPVGDKVVTELKDEKAAMAKYEAALGKDGMAAVLRIRDRIAGEKRGPRDVYMCHGFCELGAIKLKPVLRDMRDFLVANPGEVLIIVIQDESVTPQDIEKCFEESGLIEFVYRGPATAPWPTLRQMVDSDQRVLVMAENATAGVAWYHPAFQVMQETPYGFHDPSEFSNRPNRGGAGGSLMLLNHWIESVPAPKPSDAAIVNAHDALLARINAFRRERGRYPNLVAVDFYSTGDLIQVVRELNERPLARGGGARPGAAGR